MSAKNGPYPSGLLVWLKEIRAPFLTAVIVPVLLGTAVAWFSFKVFDPLYFVLCLLGAVFMHAGANVANEYFDYKSGCDTVKTDFASPFSGGSGLLPAGVLNPKKVHKVSLVFFALASVIGVFLAFVRGWVVLVLGVIGILSGYFYTAEFAPRGVGEIIVGLNFGPLVVIGSFFVQTQAITYESIAASVPLGILILEVLWVNEIPDFDADARAGKKTLVTRIGRKKAADVYAVLLFSTYAVMLVLIGLSLMPVFALISFLTLPLAVKAVAVARRNYDDPRRLLPANAGTIMIHLFTGILLCVAYVVSGYLSIL
ncbi:MAG: 1,4-dihydroxy-2-naphthoate octaprenyltransferase [Candidatus Bathyarchaeia archaeon]|jgi:1,4-dihydroxy-2-naphthoate octaprenyltransferase|nr:1,4-dihydroxy-2-naphthoate octaprenyltransferase [Candidatus Bathyarchaeota archaeon A05DMB-4]MDH7594706.1 1,4-dihydroxy-2-naphthoate octaprenyltransferase [Candidatus Bathyarchaeota archaeon]